MAKIFRTPHRVKLPKSRHEVEEFGRGKKGLIICEKCNIFYYKKSWHHNADAFVAKRENKDLPVNFTLCPACRMIKNKQYEGKVIVRNIPEKLKNEALNLIDGYCERAFLKDPLDRLVGINLIGRDVIVTVTENQLAGKLARKIKDSFNKVKIKVSFSKEPGDVALAKVEFLER